MTTDFVTVVRTSHLLVPMTRCSVLDLEDAWTCMEKIVKIVFGAASEENHECENVFPNKL